MKKADPKRQQRTELLLTHGIAAEEKAHGTVRPPWIAYPEWHPASVAWRMGEGEFHAMMVSRWLAARDPAARIEYVRRYAPVPPAWADWVGDLVGPDGAEDPDVERAIELGLVDREALERYLADPDR